MLNFKRHYLHNRAPLGLHFHAAWFENPMYLHAFTVSVYFCFLFRNQNISKFKAIVRTQMFLDDVLRLPDVYFVTSHQVIEWIRKPTPINQLHTFEPWKCNKRQFEPQELACDLPTTCKLSSRVLKSDRYLHTCFQCPKQYPWLRNEFGLD